MTFTFCAALVLRLITIHYPEKSIHLTSISHIISSACFLPFPNKEFIRLPVRLGQQFTAGDVKLTLCPWQAPDHRALCGQDPWVSGTGDRTSRGSSSSNYGRARGLSQATTSQGRGSTSCASRQLSLICLQTRSRPVGPLILQQVLLPNFLACQKYARPDRVYSIFLCITS